ncbi:MAG: pilus assembly protein PilM [Patescibacteria group bacterium]
MIDSCPNVIGIDISSSSVKAVCLDKNGILKSYGVADLPAAATDTDVILALKSVIGEKCGECRANIGLRGLDVLTKSLTVKYGSAVEIEKQVEEHLSEFLPVEREEVVVSWEVVGKENNQVKMILIVVPKKVLERYKRLIDGVGIAVNNYEINAFSLKRSLVTNSNNKTVMVADMHSDETDIEVFAGDDLILDKTIPIGGKRITKELSQRKMISIEEAEREKRANKEIEEQMVYEIYKPLRDDIVSEIVKVASMIRIEYGIEINKIVLSGGDYNSSQWRELVLEDSSKLATVEVKTPEAITQSSVLFKEVGEKMRLANAVGLALKK